jgi:hypothetical protein
MSPHRTSNGLDTSPDPRAQVLEPQPDMLLHLEVPDELLRYYLSLSRAAGMVYALAVKQLINRMYRDHDYVRRRQLEGKRTGYDTALERDQQALAWLISAAALYVPDEVKRHPVPPKPPRPRRTTPRANKAAKAKQQAKTATSASGEQSLERDAIARVQALIEAAQLAQQAQQNQDSPQV